MSSNKIFAKPGLKRMYLIGGLTLLTLGVTTFLMIGRGAPLGASIALVWVGIWMSRRPLIKLNSDHFEMKLAPLAPLRLIAYEDVKAIGKKGKKVILRVANAKGTKDVKVPQNMFSKRDFSFLVGQLRLRAGLA